MNILRVKLLSYKKKFILLLLVQFFVQSCINNQTNNRLKIYRSPYGGYIISKSNYKPSKNNNPKFDPFTRRPIFNVSSDSLIADLNNPEASVRAYAASELGNRKDNIKKIVTALTYSLEDRDKFVKRNAVKSLGSFGKHSQSSIPKLVSIAKGHDKYLADTAKNSLRKIRGY